MRNRFNTAAIIIALSAVALLSIGTSKAFETKTTAKKVTFSKDVAPIIYKSCAECHRAGEAAPMSLLSYKDVRPWAKAIREKIVKREMPHWDADPNFGKFSNDARLTQAQIDTIVSWIDQGAPEGNPKETPPVPKFTEGWAIGKPDLILSMKDEFTLEASGPDEYQYFEIPTGFTEDKYIQAVEARPGNRKIVHHIIAFIKSPQKENPNRPKFTREEMAKLRAEAEQASIQYQDGFLRRTKADAPGYNDGCSIPQDEYRKRRVQGGEGGDANNNWLVGYAPGNVVQPWEPGTVKKIPAGSSVIFQIHYSKVAGEVQKDRSSVGMIFAKGPAKKEVYMSGVSNPFMKLEPNKDNQRVSACWTADRDIHIISLTPHMHVRGTAQRIEAIFPDGKSQILLNVPTYSFAWQTTYLLTEPMQIPKGTKFLVTSVFDNSSKNKYNPAPDKTVRWGDPTYDEMMIGFIEYTVDSQTLNKPAKAAAAVSGSPTGQ
ncbi:MAG: hypothetical protein IPL01_03790 [Acidobacteria bacterium]|nr:hypothetical protein [Acidobacteriota bacterium]